MNDLEWQIRVLDGVMVARRGTQGPFWGTYTGGQAWWGREGRDSPSGVWLEEQWFEDREIGMGVVDLQPEAAGMVDDEGRNGEQAKS